MPRTRCLVSKRLPHARIGRVSFVTRFDVEVVYSIDFITTQAASEASPAMTSEKQLPRTGDLFLSSRFQDSLVHL